VGLLFLEEAGLVDGAQVRGERVPIPGRARKAAGEMSDTKRSGECLRCGQCCVDAWRFSYSGKRILPDEFDWTTVKLEKVRAADDTEGDHNICPQLVFEIETKKAVCLEYDKRGGICPLYPLGPEEVIFPGCGFSFTKENADVTISA
jgi:hypothetical protein